jgi:hypothetical protein
MGEREATRYLAACDTTATTIHRRPDGARLSVCTRNIQNADVAVWLPQQDAVEIAAEARRLAGTAPDVERLVRALREAAMNRRITLPEHRVAIERATIAAANLDQLMLQLRQSRLLRIFNRRYAEHRLACKEQGRGSIGYTLALRRLRLALIPILASGRSIDSISATSLNFQPAIFDWSHHSSKRTKAINARLLLSKAVLASGR